jgi:hypothetical protein
VKDIRRRFNDFVEEKDKVRPTVAHGKIVSKETDAAEYSQSLPPA